VIARRVLAVLVQIVAVPLGLIVALGLTDALRGLPGPRLALALPLRETGHADRASALLVACAPALVFALIALACGRRPSPAGGLLRALGVLACALTLQAISIQLVRQASFGFDWNAAAASYPPYVDALGALGGALLASGVAAPFDRWRRHGLEERPVGGIPAAPPLEKIGA
jgi:hypothetical protein